MKTFIPILLLIITTSSYLLSYQIDEMIINNFHNFDYKSEVLSETNSEATIVVANKQDSLILVNLYNATGGDNWVRKDNWLTDAPLSTWSSVLLNFDGRVTGLQLYGNNLTGTIPKELGNLNELYDLTLWGNELSGSIPPELGNLSKLLILQLTRNQLSGSIPRELGDLESLKILNLSQNQLSGSIPKELGILTNLTNLSLDRNQLSGEIPKEFGNLSNLEIMTLFENNLTGTIPKELENLRYLEILSLFSNKLSGSLPKEIGKLTNLIVLSLSENQLSGAIPDELGNLKLLTNIFLRNNNFVGKIPESFMGLKLLKLVSIRDNKFDSGLENFPSDQMDSIYIYNNKFDFADLSKASINALTYEYEPQDSLGEKEIIILEEGKEYTLSSATEHVDGNQYKWFKDGEEVPNETNHDLVISDAQDGVEGIYTCSVTNEIAPLLTLYRRPITLTFDIFANVNDYIKVTNEFMVYPNPARDFVAIEFNNPAAKSSIQILDLSGSEVMSLDVSNEALVNIDVSQFANGYYNIIINSDDKKYFQPLYVNR